MSRIYTGHVWYYGNDESGEGTDVLLTIWDDGHYEVALRPGRDQKGWTWGPPAELTEEPPP